MTIIKTCGPTTFSIAARGIMTISLKKCGIMTLLATLSIKKCGVTTLSIMTLSIMKLSIMTLSTMTLSIMTLSIMTLSKGEISVLFRINDTQHK